jgi:hypothetical protein
VFGADARTHAHTFLAESPCTKANLVFFDVSAAARESIFLQPQIVQGKPGRSSSCRWMVQICLQIASGYHPDLGTPVSSLPRWTCCPASDVKFFVSLYLMQCIHQRSASVPEAHTRPARNLLCPCLPRGQGSYRIKLALTCLLDVLGRLQVRLKTCRLRRS